MTRWTYQELEQVLDEFIGNSDPDDPKARKRLRILSTATDLFIRHGYRKTNIGEVAQRAGVAKGTVYLYFKTKADLLLHAIGHEKKKYFQQLKPIFSPATPPHRRLRLWLKTVLVLGTEMPLISKLISGDREILAVLDDVEADQSQAWEAIRVDFLSEMLDQAAGNHTWAPLELKDRASVLLGLVYFSGLITDDRIRGGLSVERYAEILTDMIVDGISASKRHLVASNP